MKNQEAATQALFGASSGRTLASLFAEEPADVDQILRIVAHVLRLLDSIHSSGLQHDPLTPNSIRFDHHHGPAIQTRSYDVARLETVAFTHPKYSLPESFIEGLQDKRCPDCDSYLLGFMLYELLLGGRRFRAQFAPVESVDALAWLRWHADRSRKLIPLAEIIPNFPRSVSNLIGEMTEKDPARRADLRNIMVTLRCAEQATTGKSVPAADEDNVIPVKVNRILRHIKERVDAAKKFANRFPECVQAGTKREPIQAWAHTRKLEPNFARLKLGFRQLKQVRREALQVRLPKGGAKWLAPIGIAVVFVSGGLLALRYLKLSKPSGPELIPVALHATIAGAHFTVDGQPSRFVSVSLMPGSHRVEASAPGYEPLSKKFNLSNSGPASVVFALQPLLPSLHLSTALKGAQYILDGDGPTNFEVLTKDHLVSGTHSLQIVKNDRQILSLNFTAAPQKVAAINGHTESENISALILSSFQDSAELYATGDWTVSIKDGPRQTVSSGGLKLNANSSSSSEVLAASVDGVTQQLNISHSKMPVVNIFVRSLPERIPVSISANVSDPVVIINGLRLDTRLVNGRAVFSLFPGKYRIRLAHRGYHDSVARDVDVNASGEGPHRLRFVLKRSSRLTFRKARHTLKSLHY